MNPIQKFLSEPELLKKIVCYQCDDCIDSTIVITPTGYTSCIKCQGNTELPLGPITQLLEVIGERVHNDEFISVTTLKLARALVKGTVEYPIPAHALLQHLHLTDPRTLKGMVATLRNDWKLPIGSSRHEDKSGYYWINKPEDALAWFNSYTAQARQEMKTAYRLIKRHYPELAGQLRFDFEEGGE